MQRLRDIFWQNLRAAFGNGVVFNGHPEKRLPNTLNVSFIGHNGAEILARMPEIAASTGSACHSGQITLSPVLKAMGISPEVGFDAIRFSLGRGTLVGRALGRHHRRPVRGRRGHRRSRRSDVYFRYRGRLCHERPARNLSTRRDEIAG